MVLSVISYLGHVKPFHDADADDDDDDDDDDDTYKQTKKSIENNTPSPDLSGTV